MAPRPHSLLVACDSQELRQFLDRQGVPTAHCLPEQIDARLREAEHDALIVAAPRYEAELAAAVRRWKNARPDLEVLLLFRLAPGTREIVDLMRAGSFDVLEAPGNLQETQVQALLRESMENLLRRVEQGRAGGADRQRARQSLADLGLLGESAVMDNLFVQLLHAARLTCPVLISGPPGSGKRLAAHAIHALSARAGHPIVTVECSSLSPALLDSILLGAPPGRGSLLEAARHGTLLLNEVGGLPYGIQLEFLRRLESAGAEGAGAAGVRILSTTSRRLDHLVEIRAFRADLCYRLNVLPIDIPPLARRLEDVPLLARYFLSRHERDNRAFELAPGALEALARYHWPGNVSELKAAMEHAAAHSVDDAIVPAHLPAPVSGARPEPGEEKFSSTELNLARLEQQAILRALQVAGFDKAKAARLLGVGKTTMYRKLKEMSARARRPVES
ncbi:MAG: sigma-54-dependent Fis family transcriptional regulator [Acidobacteria bacterium]|nr:sigma-54-dependent Fis family transcriptional regulator [Acidobacteriota bacterium]